MKKILIVIFFLFGIGAGMILRQEGAVQRVHTIVDPTLAPAAQYRIKLPLVTQLATHRQYRQASEEIMQSGLNRRVIIALASDMGKIIYRQEGIKGFDTCFEQVLDSVRVGCGHGFAGFLLHEKQTLQPLFTHCLSIPIDRYQAFCKHIIGHALLANTNYTMADIDNASAACQQFKTPDEDNHGGESNICVSGVMMEYYLLRMGKNGYGVTGDFTFGKELTFDPHNPYDICPKVGSPDLCYMEIVNWWYKWLHLPNTDIARYCEGIPSESGKMYCIETLSGFMASPLGERILGKEGKRAGLCPSTLDYYQMYYCTQTEIVGPKLLDLVHAISEECQALHLGQDTPVCEQKMLSSFNSSEF